MTRFALVPLTLLMLALAGCGEESSDIPVDGREIDGVNNQTPGVYSGRVIDGYLQGARVWLDMDGDYQYTPGPLTVVLDSGESVILPGGEPTAMSGAGGRFTLDTTELLQGETEDIPRLAPDLDPRDYPLIAVVIPGTTMQETRSGSFPLEHAYTMSAKPGVTNITPLTTLQRARRTQFVDREEASLADLDSALENINLQGDYVLAENERAHAYARALARFMGQQFPDSAEGALGEDGIEQALDSEALNLLRISLLKNAFAVINTVDQAAAGSSYSNVDIDVLVLPEEGLDLDDPVVLRRQKVFADGGGKTLPVRSTANLGQSALLTYDYDASGLLQSVTANGCMKPSLKDLVRLANAGGRISRTSMQGLTGISISQSSILYFEDQEPVDERLTLDWAGQRAEFDTGTTCHSALVGNPELGGDAELVYEWTVKGDPGRVTSITDGFQTLTPDYTNATPAFFGYTLTSNTDNTIVESVALNSDVDSCEGFVSEEDAGAARVISAQQDYEFTGQEPQPQGFGGLRLDWDIREDRNNLLRYAFLDPGVDVSNNGLQWEFDHLPVDAGREPMQVGLVKTAALHQYSGVASCGGAVELSGGSIYARIGSEYSPLSDYLIDRLVAESE
ncbi:hypothetical protein [Marinobacter sp.]|uniref:hypothetical protein n=1 Tax=Marinobacter sp. TaxID=50741 RepID=UPI00384B6D38